MEFLLSLSLVAIIFLVVKVFGGFRIKRKLLEEISSLKTEGKEISGQLAESRLTIKEYIGKVEHLEKTIGEINSLNTEVTLKLNKTKEELNLNKKNFTSLNDEWGKYAKEIELLKSIEVLKQEEKVLSDVSAKLEAAQVSLIGVNKSIDELQTLKDSGFYSLKYKFEDIQIYREAIALLKEKQKILISNGEEFKCSVKELEGTPIFKAIRAIALRTFNLEIENIAERVNARNYEDCYKKAVKSFENLNSHLSTFRSAIAEAYFETKVKELTVALEFEQEKIRIKEEQAELRNRIKDEEDARLEAEELRDKTLEAEKVASEQLEKAKQLLEVANEEEKAVMQEKIERLEKALQEKIEEKERAISLAQITKKGHVYIISNIGSFGDEVFKIGLTRRERPEERVRELGDASVPFQFDIHAVIRSEDAPRLENELHKILNDHRLNKVNSRKEFFKASIDMIQKACLELGHEVELTKLAEAKEFRQSLEILELKKAA